MPTLIPAYASRFFKTRKPFRVHAPWYVLSDPRGISLHLPRKNGVRIFYTIKNQYKAKKNKVNSSSPSINDISAHIYQALVHASRKETKITTAAAATTRTTTNRVSGNRHSRTMQYTVQLFAFT